MDDLDDYYEFGSSPRVTLCVGYEPCASKEEARQILERRIAKDEMWAIVHKSDNKVIGAIGTHSDDKRYRVESRGISFMLNEKYWGQGLMPEAVSEVLRYLFIEEGLEVVSAAHYAFNSRSKRVIEKCGFVYEGTIRRAYRLSDGSVSDDIFYSMLRSEYMDKYNIRFC